MCGCGWVGVGVGVGEWVGGWMLGRGEGRIYNSAQCSHMYPCASFGVDWWRRRRQRYSPVSAYMLAPDPHARKQTRVSAKAQPTTTHKPTPPPTTTTHPYPHTPGPTHHHTHTHSSSYHPPLSTHTHSSSYHLPSAPAGQSPMYIVTVGKNCMAETKLAMASSPKGKGQVPQADLLVQAEDEAELEDGEGHGECGGDDVDPAPGALHEEGAVESDAEPGEDLLVVVVFWGGGGEGDWLVGVFVCVWGGGGGGVD